MIVDRNLPLWERVVRLLVGIIVVAVAMVVQTHPLYRWLAAASGIGLALTALSGFCPACAMLGRRP